MIILIFLIILPILLTARHRSKIKMYNEQVKELRLQQLKDAHEKKLQAARLEYLTQRDEQNQLVVEKLQTQLVEQVQVCYSHIPTDSKNPTEP